MITQEKSKFILRNSIPIVNNPRILKWLVDCQMNSHQNQKNLSRNLIEELTKIFGKQNKSLRLEFMTKVWVLKFNDLTFNVFSAKGKGTSIEICGYTHTDISSGIKEKEIINFLEELHQTVNSI